MNNYIFFLCFLCCIIFCKTAIADDENIIQKKHITVIGTVEGYKDIGMYWFRLRTNDKKVIHLGARGNFSNIVMECLDNAEEKENPVEISGIIIRYKSGDAGMDEGTVTCTPVKNISQFKMTDTKHNKFMLESEEYILADTLLNVTWKLIKSSVSQEQYKKILAEQRDWIEKGRDVAASKYGTSMKEIDAYTKVMQDRIKKLCSYISVDPISGIYKNKEISSKFNVLTRDKKIYVSGNAINNRNYHTCDFDGEGDIEQDNGWIKLKHDNMSDFYILFIQDGAEIVYTSSAIEQGCGFDFSGKYKIGDAIGGFH